MADRFLRLDRAGFGVDVSVVGLNELSKGLRSFDPALARSLDGAIRAAIDPVVRRARSHVPDVALSGWDSSGTGEWSTRLGYDAGQIRKGIRIRKGGTRRARSGTSVAWRIQQFNAAGAVFELAGRSGGQGAQGQRFVTALTQQEGRASRLIWRAWDELGSSVEPKIRVAVANAERSLQQAVGGAVS